MLRTWHLAPGTHGTRHRGTCLLPALHAAQARVGWISEGALNHICRAPFGAAGGGVRCRVVLHHVLDEAATAVRRACVRRHRLPGERRGGALPRSRVADRQGGRRQPTVARCGCAARASGSASARRPSLFRARATDAPTALTRSLKPDDYRQRVAAWRRRTLPSARRVRLSRTVDRVYADPARLLRRVGVANPESLDEYRAHGGYDALMRPSRSGRRASSAKSTIRASSAAAAPLFPTGRKWDAVARAAGASALHGLQCRRV